MKRIAFFFAFFIFASIARGQAVALPVRVPIHCSAASACAYPYIPSGPMVGVMIARVASLGTVTDSLGNAWSRDYCYSGNGNCIFHANFNTRTNPGDTIYFPNTGFTDIFLFLYPGNWSFMVGQKGDFENQNYPFPDCINGQFCQYSWTLPVEVDAGTLLISWADINNTTGGGVAKPGLGWHIEANDGLIAVEDMIAQVDGIYIGSLIWKYIDGLQDNATAWLMGIAAYKRR